MMLVMVLGMMAGSLVLPQRVHVSPTILEPTNWSSVPQQPLLPIRVQVTITPAELIPIVLPVLDVCISVNSVAIGCKPVASLVNGQLQLQRPKIGQHRMAAWLTLQTETLTSLSVVSDQSIAMFSVHNNVKDPALLYRFTPFNTFREAADRIAETDEQQVYRFLEQRQWDLQHRLKVLKTIHASFKAGCFPDKPDGQCGQYEGRIAQLGYPTQRPHFPDFKRARHLSGTDHTDDGNRAAQRATSDIDTSSNSSSLHQLRTLGNFFFVSTSKLGHDIAQMDYLVQQRKLPTAWSTIVTSQYRELLGRVATAMTSGRQQDHAFAFGLEQYNTNVGAVYNTNVYIPGAESKYNKGFVGNNEGSSVSMLAPVLSAHHADTFMRYDEAFATANTASANRAPVEAHIPLLVLDGLLTNAALNALYNFCLEATIW
jgi:hypothetical protein